MKKSNQYQISCNKCFENFFKPHAGPTEREAQPQDLTSDVFVFGRSHPDGSEDTPPMSIINFDD